MMRVIVCGGGLSACAAPPFAIPASRTNSQMLLLRLRLLLPIQETLDFGRLGQHEYTVHLNAELGPGRFLTLPPPLAFFLAALLLPLFDFHRGEDHIPTCLLENRCQQRGARRNGYDVCELGHEPIENPTVPVQPRRQGTCDQRNDVDRAVENAKIAQGLVTLTVHSGLSYECVWISVNERVRKPLPISSLSAGGGSQRR